MDISEFCGRPDPIPWSGSHKIPWHEEAFSERMLREHLDQSHDLASRSLPKVQAQVDYFCTEVVANGGKILDLGCGPGLHCREFAARGYSCTGIDFSPASIRHAQVNDPSSLYLLEDVQTVELGSGFNLAMMLYGEFQTFPPAIATQLLERMKDAVYPDGAVVLEVQSSRIISDIGQQTPSWRAVPKGLFSDAPHFWLQEHFWLAEEQVAISRHGIVSESGEVAEYINTLQGYSDHEHVELLQRLGFRRIARKPSLTGDPGTYFMIGYCS